MNIEPHEYDFVNTLSQLLSIFSPTYRRAQRAAANVRYWARWQYSEEEWQRLDELDWARTKRWFYGTLIFFGVVAPLWWAAFYLIAWPYVSPQFEFTPSLFNAWMIFVIVAGLSFAVLFVVGQIKAYQSGKARHIERQTSGVSRVIEIGPLGICQSGKCIPLVGLNLRLTDVCIDPRDPSLFRFAIELGRGFPAGILIPIPKGQEAAANELAELFMREIVQ